MVRDYGTVFIDVAAGRSLDAVGVIRLKPAAGAARLMRTRGSADEGGGRPSWGWLAEFGRSGLNDLGHAGDGAGAVSYTHLTLPTKA